MHQGELRSTDRLGGLFEALCLGDSETFLAGCTHDVVLRARGSAPAASTTLSGSQIARWYEALQELTGQSLRLTVRLVLVDEHVVVLRHEFDRDGMRFDYETVNYCVFRDGLLAAWFSSPMNLWDHALAWGTRGMAESCALSSLTHRRGVFPRPDGELMPSGGVPGWSPHGAR
jgi:ketosteroid isomerase-like protein